MRTCIEKCVEFTLAVPRDDDRLTADIAGDVIVVVRDLALVGEVNPVSLPDVLHLQLEQVRIREDVAAATEGTRLGIVLKRAFQAFNKLVQHGLHSAGVVGSKGRCLPALRAWRQAATACSRCTIVFGAAADSRVSLKSNRMRANGLLRPALWISSAFDTRSTGGIRSFRVPNAKSSCRYLSPSMLICVVSWRQPGAVTKKWMCAGRWPWRPSLVSNCSVFEPGGQP